MRLPQSGQTLTSMRKTRASNFAHDSRWCPEGTAPEGAWPQPSSASSALVAGPGTSRDRSACRPLAVVYTYYTIRVVVNGISWVGQVNAGLFDDGTCGDEGMRRRPWVNGGRWEWPIRRRPWFEPPCQAPHVRNGHSGASTRGVCFRRRRNPTYVDGAGAMGGARDGRPTPPGSAE